MLQNSPHNSFVCSGIYYGEVLAPILILSVSYLNLLLLLLSYSHSVLSTVSKMILVDATAQIHNRFTSRVSLCINSVSTLSTNTKSKSYALHTFCILSAYFIKNIYITCQRTIAKATEEAVLVSSSLSRTLQGFHPSSVSIRRITARLSDSVR